MCPHGIQRVRCLKCWYEREADDIAESMLKRLDWSAIGFKLPPLPESLPLSAPEWMKDIWRTV